MLMLQLFFQVDSLASARKDNCQVTVHDSMVHFCNHLIVTADGVLRLRFGNAS